MNLMTLRPLLLGGITASFAVGGFLVGHHRPAPQESSSLEVKTPNFQRVKRNRLGVVIKANAKRLNLTDAQVRQVTAITEPSLQREIKHVESQWSYRVMAAEKVATGEWLPQTVDFGWAFTGNGQPMPYITTFSPWFSFSYEPQQVAKIKKIIGKKAIDQAMALARQIGQRDMARALEFATSPSTLEKLNLSPLQERQFETLRKRIKSNLTDRKPSGTGIAKMPDGAPVPHVPEAMLQPIALQVAFGLLDMKQALVLETMVWDILTVER
ncbi:MAG: hypothetical protein ACO1SV_13015 [Fimbriimonas sp.]